MLYKSFLLNLINEIKNGKIAHNRRMTMEIPNPPPEPKTSLKIAPVCPSIAEILSCNKTKILANPTGFNAVSVAIMPSIG
jgi:hypothetical protein